MRVYYVYGLVAVCLKFIEDSLVLKNLPTYHMVGVLVHDAWSRHSASGRTRTDSVPHGQPLTAACTACAPLLDLLYAAI